MEGNLIVNPTVAQLDESDMDIVVAGTADNIIMVEGGCREVPEADLVQALEFAMTHIRAIVAAPPARVWAVLRDARLFRTVHKRFTISRHLKKTVVEKIMTRRSELDDDTYEEQFSAAFEWPITTGRSAISSGTLL